MRPAGGFRQRTMKRPLILIADDDAVFAASVASILRMRYRVRTAVNGTEALAEVENDPPDLVILDVMMDHMSEGFDVARKLRTDPATALIPIIILTGVDRVYNLRMEVDESWVPADLYLEKPIAPDELLQAVESLVGPGVPDDE
ncbi:MAG: response regulator [Thermoanaerobaculales bacterium]|nr:response regulator [Thermoanaerobaculales bacterium]